MDGTIIDMRYHRDSNQNTEWGEGRVGGGAEEVKNKCAIIEGGNIWNIPLPHNISIATVKSIELKIEHET